ncbi:ribosomal L7Ae/L30e/S12e/Gadd45 family protein [Candidatus Woesearchaeota archaeon]|nr:ribosomal L7Ae/L30e/S12e/Gadd45 family protein [Nanoarchaeota archaeon]MCB9370117.1 ribosomal L7Ae/L30e/S12e/Gadd45 family protein [Candidatus Woesearchaeota archaeon]USN44648.1 MAG: ribosomal L7Ae/L30e/S12e/Gadd45 family protein [Candidatus Woesearchaeota archaeon]
MEDPAEMYVEEVTPANELKGFTKSFVKRTKDKREEHKEIKAILTALKENRLVLGTKVTEKMLKSGKTKHVYISSTCDNLVLRKLQHYCALAEAELSVLHLNSNELAQKLAKPFNITVACEKEAKK